MKPALSKELSNKLKDKKKTSVKRKRKEECITKTEYQQIARICKDKIRKVKTQNELQKDSERFITNVKKKLKVSFNI